MRMAGELRMEAAEFIFQDATDRELQDISAAVEYHNRQGMRRCAVLEMSPGAIRRVTAQGYQNMYQPARGAGD